MIGKQVYQAKLIYSTTLEDLVPKDNFYRKLREILDLNFIYSRCKNLYGKTGNKSIDPVVFFLINIFGYFENISSDRELMDRISDSYSARLFLGYDYDEALPWHSTISRTRKLMPEEIYEEIFNRILQMCVEAGLVEGNHQSVDSTLVKANASLERLVRKNPRLTLKEYIEEIKIKNEKEGEEKEEPQTGQELKKIENHGNIKRRKLSNENYESKTDSDSRIAKKPGKPTNLYYAVHYAVDSQEKIITDVLSSHADKSDASKLIEVVERSEKRLNNFDMKIKSVGADKNYCSGENLEQLEKKKIEPYIPSQKHPNSTGKIDKKEFIYDNDKDVYICPAKKELTYRFTNERRKAKVYFANKGVCQACTLKENCTTCKGQRKVQHSIYIKEYSRLDKRMNSEKGKEAMKMRKIHTEPLFAEAKLNHGLAKFSTRGLCSSQKNAYIIAGVQNLKRLMKCIKRNAQSRMLSQIKEQTKGIFYHFKEINKGIIELIKQLGSQYILVGKM